MHNSADFDRFLASFIEDEADMNRELVENNLFAYMKSVGGPLLEMPLQPNPDVYPHRDDYARVVEAWMTLCQNIVDNICDLARVAWMIDYAIQNDFASPKKFVHSKIIDLGIDFVWVGAVDQLMEGRLLSDYEQTCMIIPPDISMDGIVRAMQEDAEENEKYEENTVKVDRILEEHGVVIDQSNFVIGMTMFSYMGRAIAPLEYEDRAKFYDLQIKKFASYLQGINEPPEKWLNGLRALLESFS